MVGADLANLVNEAALLAARRAHDHVAEADFTDALERIVLGAERQVMMSEADRRRTAYHEGGHALVGMLSEGADPVRKISIIPRGMALGVTFSAPDADRFNYDRSELIAKIKVALGGRAAPRSSSTAEPTTGAESDIEQLTAIARQMVGRWGMSEEIGPLAVLPSEGRGPLLPGVCERLRPHARSASTTRCAASSTRPTRRCSRSCARTGPSSTLSPQALLEHETLDEDDAYAAASVPHPRAPEPAALPPDPVDAGA